MGKSRRVRRAAIVAAALSGMLLILSALLWLALLLAPRPDL